MNVLYLVSAIKKRPLFFLLSHSIFEFDAFVRGYSYHQFSHEQDKTPEDKIFEEFKCSWLQSKLGLKGNYSYVQCLMSVSNNSAEALDRFFDYWEVFICEKKIRVVEVSTNNN